jgi:hypothetical protein
VRPEERQRAAFAASDPTAKASSPRPAGFWRQRAVSRLYAVLRRLSPRAFARGRGPPEAQELLASRSRQLSGAAAKRSAELPSHGAQRHAACPPQAGWSPGARYEASQLQGREPQRPRPARRPQAQRAWAAPPGSRRRWEERERPPAARAPAAVEAVRSDAQVAGRAGRHIRSGPQPREHRGGRVTAAWRRHCSRRPRPPQLPPRLRRPAQHSSRRAGATSRHSRRRW